jgi:hypothetical protein
MADRSFRKCFNEMELLTIAALLLSRTPRAVLYTWAEVDCAKKKLAETSKMKRIFFMVKIFNVGITKKTSNKV